MGSRCDCLGEAADGAVVSVHVAALSTTLRAVPLSRERERTPTAATGACLHRAAGEGDRRQPVEGAAALGTAVRVRVDSALLPIRR